MADIYSPPLPMFPRLRSRRPVILPKSPLSFLKLLSSPRNPSQSGFPPGGREVKGQQSRSGPELHPTVTRREKKQRNWSFGPVGDVDGGIQASSAQLKTRSWLHLSLGIEDVLKNIIFFRQRYKTIIIIRCADTQFGPVTGDVVPA